MPYSDWGKQLLMLLIYLSTLKSQRGCTFLMLYVHIPSAPSPCIFCCNQCSAWNNSTLSLSSSHLLPSCLHLYQMLCMFPVLYIPLVLPLVITHWLIFFLLTSKIYRNVIKCVLLSWLKNHHKKYIVKLGSVTPWLAKGHFIGKLWNVKFISWVSKKPTFYAICICNLSVTNLHNWVKNSVLE